jgi:hypothetical protein
MSFGFLLGAIAIDQLLGRKFDQLARFEEMLTFNVANSREGPAGTNSPLVPRFSHCTLLTPVPRTWNLDVRRSKVTIHALRRHRSHEHLLPELLLSHIGELVDIELHILATYPFSVKLSDELDVALEDEEPSDR